MFRDFVNRSDHGHKGLCDWVADEVDVDAEGDLSLPGDEDTHLYIAGFECLDNSSLNRERQD